MSTAPPTPAPAAPQKETPPLTFEHFYANLKGTKHRPTMELAWNAACTSAAEAARDCITKAMTAHEANEPILPHEIDPVLAITRLMTDTEVEEASEPAQTPAITGEGNVEGQGSG